MSRFLMLSIFSIALVFLFIISTFISSSLAQLGDDSPNLTTVFAILPEAPGTNCANGGTLIASGLDNNGNGNLNFNEVQHVGYTCNGEQGPQGIAGADGATGPEGPAGEQGDPGPQGIGVGINSSITNDCNGLPGSGGVRVTPFFDANNNGTQDTGETDITDATFDICEGPPGPVGDPGPQGPPGPTADAKCPCFNDFSIANGFKLTPIINKDPSGVLCDLNQVTAEAKFPGTPMDAIYADTTVNALETDIYMCSFDPYLIPLQDPVNQDAFPAPIINELISFEQFVDCSNTIEAWLESINIDTGTECDN